MCPTRSKTYFFDDPLVLQRVIFFRGIRALGTLIYHGLEKKNHNLFLKWKMLENDKNRIYIFSYSLQSFIKSNSFSICENCKTIHQGNVDTIPGKYLQFRRLCGEKFFNCIITSNPFILRNRKYIFITRKNKLHHKNVTKFSFFTPPNIFSPRKHIRRRVGDYDKFYSS